MGLDRYSKKTFTYKHIKVTKNFVTSEESFLAHDFDKS